MTTLKSSTEKQIQNIRLAQMKLADMALGNVEYTKAVMKYKRLYGAGYKRALKEDELSEFMRSTV